MRTEQISLPASAPGHQRALTVHHFGEGRRKAYLHAGLHADEWPGMLVLQHLMTRLTELEAQGQVKEHIVVVPFANPVGMNQRLFGYIMGRFDAVTGQNFNRGMAIDLDELLTLVQEKLTDDAEANDQVMRTALTQQAGEATADYETQALHRAILQQSLDANLVFDLHCDDVALPHIFYGDHQREQGRRLGDCLGFPVRLEEDVRGTVAFDGTHTQPWVKVAEATGKPFADPCFAVTLELRGNTDVNDALAQRDAEGILAFLEQEGYVSASLAQPQPQSERTVAINVDRVKVVRAETSGLVVYHRQLGERIESGDHLADIVLLDRARPERLAVTAPASGTLFARTQRYLVYPGASIAMIASDERQIKPGKQLTF